MFQIENLNAISNNAPEVQQHRHQLPDAFRQRIKHHKRVSELLSPYSLEISVGASIFDPLLPCQGGYVSGITADKVVICERDEFLNRNPILRNHILHLRKAIIETFKREQAEAHAWVNK